MNSLINRAMSVAAIGLAFLYTLNDQQQIAATYWVAAGLFAIAARP